MRTRRPFVMSGGAVDLSMDEIDDALAKAMAAPPEDRGPVWQAWTDSLLDMKLRLQEGTRYAPSKITRIVHPTETRA